MNNSLIVSIVAAAIVFGGGGFYAGMQYQAGKTPSRAGGAFAGGNFAGRIAGAGSRTAGAGGAFGTIIAKDATSITVQLSMGTSTASGSKIVLYDTSTQIGKMVTGSTNDLAIGENVTVSGTPNSDGSITAQNIQIRPAGTGRPQQ